MSGQNSRLLGKWGEAQAAGYLTGKGYALLCAGWRCRFGEIDLIVSNRTTLAFVEVKLRKNDSFASAGEAVDRRKQEKLRTTAELYLAEHPTKLQPRFDVVEVYAPQGMNTPKPVFRHLENAF